MAEQQLTVGMKVKVIEEGECVDEAIVRSVGTWENSGANKIGVESLKFCPGMTTEFVFIQVVQKDGQEEWGWRELFEDPFTYRSCFSQRAPTYTFESA